MNEKYALFFVLLGGIFFVPLNAQSQPAGGDGAIEIFVAGQKYGSVADYHEALKQRELEALQKAAAAADAVKSKAGQSAESGPPGKSVKGVVPGVPYQDEKGWKTIRVAPSSGEDEPADDLSQEDSGDVNMGHYVAGMGAVMPPENSREGRAVHKVRSIKELNEGLARQANGTTAPLLVVSEEDRVRLLKLTRKSPFDQPDESPENNP